jgi:hypothetical protein
MEVEILPHRLRLASLSLSKLPEATHSLLRCIHDVLEPALTSNLNNDTTENNDNNAFLSITQTPDEVSLILSTNALEYFPAGMLTVCDMVWRALQVYPGESGGDPRTFYTIIARVY